QRDALGREIQPIDKTPCVLRYRGEIHDASHDHAFTYASDMHTCPALSGRGVCDMELKWRRRAFLRRRCDSGQSVFGRSRRLGQSLDLVGPEAGPVVAVGEDDGRLLVAECLDRLESFGIGGVGDGIVLQSMPTQRPVRGVTLHSGLLAEDGDGHDRRPFQSFVGGAPCPEYPPCNYILVIRPSGYRSPGPPDGIDTTPCGA